MVNDLRNFRQFPGTVQLATILLFSGWALFYFFYFHYLGGQGFSKGQEFAGLLCCICFLTFRNWARVLAILCNIMVSFMFLILCYGYFKTMKIELLLVTGTMVALFAVSTYCLLVRESADFFKSFHSLSKDGQ